MDGQRRQAEELRVLQLHGPRAASRLDRRWPGRTRGVRLELLDFPNLPAVPALHGTRRRAVGDDRPSRLGDALDDARASRRAARHRRRQGRRDRRSVRAREHSHGDRPHCRRADRALAPQPHGFAGSEAERARRRRRTRLVPLRRGVFHARRLRAVRGTLGADAALPEAPRVCRRRSFHQLGGAPRSRRRL